VPACVNHRQYLNSVRQSSVIDIVGESCQPAFSDVFPCHGEHFGHFPNCVEHLGNLHRELISQPPGEGRSACSWFLHQSQLDHLPRNGCVRVGIRCLPTLLHLAKVPFWRFNGNLAFDDAIPDQADELEPCRDVQTVDPKLLQGLIHTASTPSITNTVSQRPFEMNC
jgi:hypothetical protein